MGEYHACACASGFPDVVDSKEESLSDPFHCVNGLIRIKKTDTVGLEYQVAGHSRVGKLRPQYKIAYLPLTPACS